MPWHLCSLNNRAHWVHGRNTKIFFAFFCVVVVIFGVIYFSQNKRGNERKNRKRKVYRKIGWKWLYPVCTTQSKQSIWLMTFQTIGNILSYSSRRRRRFLFCSLAESFRLHTFFWRAFFFAHALNSPKNAHKHKSTKPAQFFTTASPFCESNSMFNVARYCYTIVISSIYRLNVWTPFCIFISAK